MRPVSGLLAPAIPSQARRLGDAHGQNSEESDQADHSMEQIASQFLEAAGTCFV
jgi:hypothetical protein